MYGSSYDPAIGILRIIVWYSSFGYYGGAKDVWILAEQKQGYLIWLNLSGALGNIFLNALWIPQFGAMGAAVASLCTQFFVNVVMGFMIRELRPNNVLMLKSLHPKYFIEIVKIVLQKNKSN